MFNMDGPKLPPNDPAWVSSGLCPQCADLRQMLSWAAGLLREHHREEADRIFDYLNRRAGGE